MRGEVESATSWLRLVVTLMLSPIGGIGLWSVDVCLPAVAADVGVSVACEALPGPLSRTSGRLDARGMGTVTGTHGVVRAV